MLPDDTPVDTKTAFNALLSSLLLNSAVAANKVGGSDNANVAVKNTTRALNKLQLSDADKGQ